MVQIQVLRNDALQWLGYIVLLVCVTAVSQGSSDPHSNRPDRAPLPSSLFPSGQHPVGTDGGTELSLDSAGPHILNGTAYTPTNGHGTNGHKGNGECLLHMGLVPARLELMRRKSVPAALPEIVAGNAMALDEEGNTTYRGQKKTPKAEWDPGLETVRFFSSVQRETNQKRELVRYSSDSRVFMPIAHGNGAWYSHSGPMLDFVTLVTRASKKRSGSTRDGNTPSVRETLFERFPDLVVAAEAKDDPGHGMGPDPDKFPTVDHWIEWEASYLREVKRFGLPVVPLAKSGSTAKYMQLIQKYPDLLDGLILISPVHPSIKLKEDVARLHQFVEDGEFVPNMWGFDWAVKMVGQMDFQHNPQPFNGVPVLVMYGGMDYEVSKEVYAEYERLTENVPSGDIARTVRVPGGGHNLLASLPAFPSANDLLYLYQLHAKAPFNVEAHKNQQLLWDSLRAELKRAMESLGMPLPPTWETDWANIRTNERAYGLLLSKLAPIFAQYSDYIAPSVRDILHAPLESHLAIYEFLQNDVIPNFERSRMHELPDLRRVVAMGEEAPSPNGNGKSTRRLQ
ncbi:MAG: hypothetical protein H6617_08810 [Bdellovibrionaceae bacterium]|nr:hypothetical protein [Bdellovibrionales bacterium]MCB9254767.1 hypothetical protein [Pseudobdellovibrionaceae bacterium]